jgi:hypothetical protein
VRYTPKVLGLGVLEASRKALYSVPRGALAVVRLVTYYNTNASARTATLYLVSNGSEVRIDARSIAGTTADRFEAILTLSDGDSIEGLATAATSVEWAMFGVETGS